MRMNSRLTIEYVRSILDFDPETGVFLWSASQSNRIKAGSRAGVIATNGRRYISVACEKIMAHRLAWFHHYGTWPNGDVKQKNGNYDDCSIDNLVDQSRQVTASSRKVNLSSKSGYPGVTWDTKRGKWQVHITRDYKQVALGYSDSLEVAVTMRKEAEAHPSVSVTNVDREKTAHAISRRRRQRTAWRRLIASEQNHSWESLEGFCRDVGDIPETKMALVAVDSSKPVGPENFRWSLPADFKHDFQTPEGRSVYGKAHRKANREIYRERELRKNFDIGVAEYDQMLVNQDGACAICFKPETAEKHGRVLALSVDHNHETGRIRGLLCGQCNTGIGKFGDDIDLLMNAISYLRKRAVPAPFICDNPNRDWLHVATPGFVN